jgi:hypothetical protein
MGTVTPSDTLVAWGEPVVFTATPSSAGYKFVRWEKDGSRENPRTVTVTQDTTLTAVFKQIPFQVYGTVNESSMGTVTPSDTLVAPNQPVEFTATPAEWHRFVRWEEEGLEEDEYNDDNPYTVIVTQDITITAVFEQIIFEVHGRISESRANMGEVTPSDMSVPGGESVVFTAIPYLSEGYKFVKWVENDSNKNPDTVTVTQDTTLTALFAATAPIYRVTLRANDDAMGTLKGDGEFAQNTQAEIRAVAKSNYSFVRWNDGEKTNPRTITVNKDTTFTAVFGYQITLMVNNTNGGEVKGAGSYEKGTTAEIRAIPAEGYLFAKWQDNDTNNPRTITVNGKKTYTAYFGTNPSGNMTEIASGVVLYPNPVRNVLRLRSAVALERISIYNLSGQQVKHVASPGTEVNVSDLPRGLYFVRLITADGNESVRKMAKE